MLMPGEPLQSESVDLSAHAVGLPSSIVLCSIAFTMHGGMTAPSIIQVELTLMVGPSC